MRKQRLWTPCGQCRLSAQDTKCDTNGGRSRLPASTSTTPGPGRFIAFRASGDGILGTNMKLLLWVPVAAKHHQMVPQHLTVGAGLDKKGVGRHGCVSLCERSLNTPRTVSTEILKSMSPTLAGKHKSWDILLMHT